MSRPSQKRSAPSSLRLRAVERCEERIVAAADFFFAAADESVLTQAATPTTQADGRGWTDVEYVRSQYGLRGNNQAVAIIDSGIAYDHIALGGGLGAGKKVIGGYDFAENDTNPYDDGPSGFHGTHVAGIVAANDGTYPGVAPGASLVGLRVFQDNGTGNFAWIESALRWVHDNRNSLGVQVTTVNLSIGTDWNAENTPNWAMLEDEFATLKADGIFISVAAGNSFANYNAPGLSYPAASPYVVPVSSVGATGLFSKFSQRSARSIAAPGERIMSTVPDWFNGGDGVKNDWSLASGTSMASPYVAGASTLLREAMTAFRQTANQDAIYNLMRNTATTFYDATTNANYLKLNLQAAVDSLSGIDELADSAAGAAAIGRLGTPAVYAKFNNLSDSDWFSFVADKSGTLQMNLNNPGGGTQTWQVVGGTTTQGSSLTLNVVAGQTYTIGVSSSAIGQYLITSTLAGSEPITPPSQPPATPPTQPPATPPATPPTTPAPPTSIDWSRVESMVQNNLQINGTNLYRLQAARNGILTIEGLQTGGAGVTLELLAADNSRVGIGTVVNGVVRMDLNVAAGSSYTLKITGTTSDLDLRLNNLAYINAQGLLEIDGTSGTDRFDVDMGRSLVTVNGTMYAFAVLNGVSVRGGAGADLLTVTGGAAAERVSLGPGTMTISGGSTRLVADSVETIQASLQKADNVTVQDSRGNDTLSVSQGAFSVVGDSYSLGVTGAGVSTINLTAGGSDTGNFASSAGSLQVNRVAGTVTATSGGSMLVAKGLEQSYQVNTSGLKARVAAADELAATDFSDSSINLFEMQAAVEAIAVETVAAKHASAVTILTNTATNHGTAAGVFENLDVELETVLASAADLQRELANVTGSADSATDDSDEEIQSRTEFFATLDGLE